MTNKKKSVVKKEIPVKKSKEIVKPFLSDIPEEQKSLSASVKKKGGATQCTLVICKEEIAVLAKSTGCKNFAAATYLITSGMDAIMSGINGVEKIEKSSNDYLSMMAELKPKDAFEGMLVSQMGVNYVQAMDCLRMAAANKEYSKIYERFQNQAIKLMRLYNQQLETLDKHRNKGRQKMTVKHVHVHDGGQAIVGTVTQGGGASNEK
ncbi:hypothetical protein [Desulfobacula sp.]|uniref:hypothetical protein n=1 Tax=Desulfobacula sp. TaxID=2593537 RepID=UPI00262A5468|nr:hypothetical protein [Desulfobacula sp.]